jgi:hypothetical protein
LGFGAAAFGGPKARVPGVALLAGGFALPVLVLDFTVTAAPSNAAAKFGTQTLWPRFVPPAQVCCNDNLRDGLALRPPVKAYEPLVHEVSGSATRYPAPESRIGAPAGPASAPA